MTKRQDITTAMLYVALTAVLLTALACTREPDAEVEPNTWTLVTSTSAVWGLKHETYKMHVPGGWLYREQLRDGERPSVAVCFVPDVAPERS